ncbi:hypothetical protein E2C01_003506 [Portunus trituberculatus]|uniref:Uncharacterized protein n=1 Tax=Portunus trituberculatus TaxID=210409 RepID=A0A5B7CMD1_PORTR|nr:hypothetical protein [Portunus trituberculatus]
MASKGKAVSSTSVMKVKMLVADKMAVIQDHERRVNCAVLCCAVPSHAVPCLAIPNHLSAKFEIKGQKQSKNLAPQSLPGTAR